MAAPAIELATGYVSLTTSTRGLGRQIVGDLGSYGDEGGQSFGRRFTQRLGDTVKLATKTGAAIGTAVATAAGVSGFRRLQALEEAESRLDSMGLSAASTEKLMGALNDTLTGTPYALDAGATAMAGFVSSGMDLDKIPGVLASVTDAAAFGRAEFSDVAEIFNQVSIGGRAVTNDLRMLEKRGIPAFSLLQDALGMTGADFSAFVSAGKLDADTFFEAWELGAKGFGEQNITMAGAAQGAGRDVRGAWGNTLTALARIGATVLGPLYERIPDGLGRIKDRLDGVNDSLGPMVQRFVDSGRIGDTLYELRLGVEALVNGWQGGSFFSDGNRALDILHDIGGTARENLEPLADIWASVAQSAIDAWPSIQRIALALARAVGEVGISTWRVFLALLEAQARILEVAVVPALEKLADFMERHPGAVRATVAAYTAWKLGSWAVDAAKGVAKLGAKAGATLTKIDKLGLKLGISRELFGRAASGVDALGLKLGISRESVAAFTSSMRAMAVSLATNPVVLVIAGIVALGAALYLAYRHVEPFRDAVDQVGRVLRDRVWPVLQDVAGIVKGAFSAAVRFGQRTVDRFAGPVVALGTALGRWLIEPLRTVGEILLAVFRGDFGRALAVARGFPGRLVAIFGEIVSGAGRVLGALWPVVRDALVQVGAWLATKAAPALARKAVELGGALLSWSGDLAGRAISASSSAMASLGVWLATKAAPALARKAGELAVAFLGWITRTIALLPLRLANLLGFIVGWTVYGAYRLGEAVVGFAVAFLGWVVQVAVDLPGHLVGLWATLAAWLTETASGLADRALDLASSFLSWVGQVVVDLPGQLWDIVTAFSTWVVRDAGPAVAARALDLASSFLSWVGQVVVDLPGQLASIGSEIVGWLASVPGLITDAVPAIVEGAMSIGRALLDGIGEGLMAAGRFVGNVAANIWNGIKRFLNEHLIDPIRDFEVTIGPWSAKPFGFLPRFTVNEGGPEGGRFSGHGMAAGGFISGGIPGKDSVPALLMPGEFVLTKAAVDELGLATVTQLNKGVLPRFAEGGRVGPVRAGEPVDWDPKAGTAVDAWADAVVARLSALPGEISTATVGPLAAWARRVSDDLSRWVTGWHTQMDRWADGSHDRARSLAARVSATVTAAGDAWVTAMATAADRLVDTLTTRLERGGVQVSGIVDDYARSLADGINPILDAIGAEQVRFAAGGAVERFARGGYVDGGVPGRDSVPALLMPGEVVINKASVDRYGRDNLLALNAGQLPGFARGGLVGRTGNPTVDNLHPLFLAAWNAFNASQGGRFSITSGWRPYERQAQLFAQLGPRMAARPGTSNHEFGLAIDHSPHSTAASRAAAAAFNLRYPMGWEPWHVEPENARAMRAGTGGFSMDLPAPPPLDHEGAFAAAGAAAMKHIHDHATDWMTNAFTASWTTGGGDMAGAEVAAGWARAAMAITGVPERWFAGLMTIGRRESNYDNSAINTWDSNARRGTPSKGWLQIIQPTFDAHALPGLGDIWDPVHAGVAVIRYIQSRYGDISRVQQANPLAPPRGYGHGGEVVPFVHRRAWDSGGTLKPGWNAVRNDTGGDEPLVPAGRRDAPLIGALHTHDDTDVDLLLQRLDQRVRKGKL